MENKPLRVYVDAKWRVEGLGISALLYPFWGTPSFANLPFAAATWRHGFDAKYLVLVDTPDEADYLLLPHDCWRVKKLRPDILADITDASRKYKKPILIDASGDASGKIDVPNSRILRINQYRFELPKNEITVPVQCEDLLESYCDGALQVREKSGVPSVGFVGWGRLGGLQRWRSLTKEVPLRIAALFNTKLHTKEKGVFWRERAARIFNLSPRVRADFIIRPSYSGHAGTMVGDAQENRRAFVQNILGTDYTLVVKGDANAATRFYEVLSLGRIPVLIDTACVLPIERLIDYRECCVVIDCKDLARAPAILADLHAKLSSEQFVDMQRKARHIYETYLRYDVFTRYLVEELLSSKPTIT